ncbi:hypothetical protein VPHD239_0082 [Vibrio phage D239]
MQSPYTPRGCSPSQTTTSESSAHPLKVLAAVLCCAGSV